MNKDHACILTINAGSSSIKFALFKAGKILTRSLQGKIDRMGLKDSEVIFYDGKGNQKDAPIISKENESVAVQVIHTDEEWMIAKTVSQILNITKK